MSQTTIVLAAIIATLLLYYNRTEISHWLQRRAGDFTIFRLFFDNGRFSDFISYNDESYNRLYKEVVVDCWEKDKVWNNGAGNLIRYEIIKGYNYDWKDSLTGEIKKW